MVLIKYSGKYVKIDFNMKITFLCYGACSEVTEPPDLYPR